jgi:hypothetical protein
METLVGFAFGYWVGTRQGREGLQRALDAAREIYDSPEARRIAGEALSALPVPSVTGLVAKAAGQRGAEIRDLLDEFVERRYGRQPDIAA